MDKKDNSKQAGLSLKRVQQIQLRMLIFVDEVCSKHNIRYWLDGGTLLGAIRHQGVIPWDDDIDVAMPRDDYERFLSIAGKYLPEEFFFELAKKSDNKRSYAIPCKIRHRYSLIVEATKESIDDEGKGIFLDVIPVDCMRESRVGFAVDRGVKRIYRALSRISYGGEPNSLLIFISRVLSLFSPFFSSETPIRVWYAIVQRFVIPQAAGRKGSSVMGYGFDVYWVRFFESKHLFPLKKVSFEGRDFFVPHCYEAILEDFYGKYYMSYPAIEHRKPNHIVSVRFDVRSEESPHKVMYFE